MTKIWDRFVRFVRVLAETVKVVAAILAILVAGGLWTMVQGALSSNFLLLLIGIVIAIISILVMVALFTWVEKLYKDPRHAEDSDHRWFDVKIQLKKVNYKYFADLQTMELVKFYKIIALQNGVTQFIDRYKWTGNGSCQVHLLTRDGQKLVCAESEVWNLNKILFDIPMMKGETREIAIRWDLFDESKKAQPFLSQGIDVPTDRLILRVILPSEPKEITLWEFPDYQTLDVDPNRSVKRKGEYDKITGEIVYDIAKPKLGHKFKIGWVL